MEEHFLALDFGSGQITAALTVYDASTSTCRVHHAMSTPCSSVSAGYILDFDHTVQTLSGLLAEINEYAPFTPTPVVGLRGNFLSFKRTSGFLSVQNPNQLITDQDVQAVLDRSVPENLGEEIEMVHLLPQCFTLDGKMGVNPVGLTGMNLEVESFVSCALHSHLHNLQRVLTQSGGEDFILLPTVLALCDTLLKPEEKRTGVLLIDLGAQNTSAALYHKGLLEGAWEIPFGTDQMVQEVCDTLQNEFAEARQLVRHYNYGEDEILDDVLEEAAKKLMSRLRKELLQDLSYIKYAPSQIVLSGGGAQMAVKNAAKTVFSARRVRLATHEQLIADSEDMLAPCFTSAISLALYAQKHGTEMGISRPSAKGKTLHLWDKILAALGLN